MYCIQQAAEWHEKYATLHAAGRATDTTRTNSWTYTKEAYDIFPRYNLLAAIQHNIEAFVPADFDSIDTARRILSLAGETAIGAFNKNPNDIEVAAITDERYRFIAYIQGVTEDAFLQLQLLPFRRALGQTEHRDLMQKFERVWGRWYGGCVNAEIDIPAHATIHIKAMDEPNAYRYLQEALARRGYNRVFELREGGDGYELDAEGATFLYDGAEGFWMSADLNWMVYASHEASIAFGGAWLVDAMRLALRNFEHYLYKGWDVGAYDPPV